MSNPFDELTKGLAQSVTRRAALKRFGVGLAGMALACLAVATRSLANPPPTDPCLPLGYACKRHRDCCSGNCVKPRKGSWYSIAVCG